MKKWSPLLSLAVLAILKTISVASDSIPIEVYHLLVQFKNGRVVERFITHSEAEYKHCFKGYIEKVVMLQKEDFSQGEFIQAFGRKNYHRLMTGYFGLGLEEEIIILRNGGGLEVAPKMLPPPDRHSKTLEKKFLQHASGDQVLSQHQAKKAFTLKDGDPLLAHGDEPWVPVKGSLKEEGPDLSVATHVTSPEEAEENRCRGATIEIHRFLVEYINGRTVEKVSTQTPEAYQEHYRGYVRQAASLGKTTYTIKGFRKAFGEKNYHLLTQGLFGKDDTDIIMENRIRRGIQPDPIALPTPSMGSHQLAKRPRTRLEN